MLGALLLARAAADDQGWAALFVTGLVAKNSSLLLWFDNHARFSEVSDDFNVMIVRPGLGWCVRPGLDLWAGYARVDRHLLNRNIVEERIWQQATYGIAKPWGGTLTGRTRLEQRFRSGDAGRRVR